MKNLVVIAGMATLIIGFSACNSTQKVAAPGNGRLASAGQTVPEFNLVMMDGSGNTVSASSLIAGTYYLKIVAINGASNDDFECDASRTDMVTPPPATQLMVSASTSTAVTLGAGNWALSCKAKDRTTGTTFPPRIFEAIVTCLNPLPLNVDASKLSVSGGDNAYTYDASGSASGGIPPYSYAIDATGDGSQDLQFQPSPTFSNVYENFIGNRSSIGLLVKDSCNTVKSVTAQLNIPAGGLHALVPGGGIPYIHGVVTSAVGTAASYKDVWDLAAGIEYYATNNSAADPVQPIATIVGTNLAFNILSDKFTYGLLSSKAFGMNLSLGNMPATLGTDLASTSFDTSNARLSTIDFSTEQVGDGLPQDKLTGGYPNCSVSGVVVKKLKVVGTPCKPGTTNAKWGDKEMKWTIEVGAYFSCTGLTDASGSKVNMTGDFDGANDIVDGCVGGGQGQGGGIQPQTF